MLKPVKIGSVNVAGEAWIFDKNDNHIATCLDTPNNIAAAFVMFSEGVRVTASFPEISKTRSEYEDRFDGLNIEYHKQFIKKEV